MKLIELGYIGLNAKDADLWRPFAANFLGMQTIDLGLGNIALRMDEMAQRLIVQPSNVNGLGFLGLRVENENEFEIALKELRDLKTEAKLAKPDECELRGVEKMFSFQDPDGNALEIYYGPKDADSPFAPSRKIGPFRTGDLGVGHVAINTTNLPRLQNFYQNVLGFRLSDYINGEMEARWFHVNKRHHSLALVDSKPGFPTFHHFMVEYKHLDDVGRLYDMALLEPNRVQTTLGRHSNDHMLSFYASSPSGFLVEAGWGGRIIPDSNSWVPKSLHGLSMWGHDRTWMPDDLRALMRQGNDFAAAQGMLAPMQPASHEGFDLTQI